MIEYRQCVRQLGVAQGSVSGPVLFNFFVADCPEEEVDEEESFADDFDFPVSECRWDEIAARLQPAIYTRGSVETN